MPIELGSIYGKVWIDASGVSAGLKKASGEVREFGATVQQGFTPFLKGAGVSLNTFKEGFTNMGMALARVVGGATVAGTVIKKAFDLAEAGAQVSQMHRAFDGLLLSVGASPALLEDLRQASRGTITDMELMASTSTLLAGTQGELATALASATPRLMEIAKAASALNPSLGDTTFLYDSLARGIKRSSPLILDNLGIVVSVAQANRNYAASIGKAVDQLTVEEKKIALLNATLEQGQVLVTQAGVNADGLADGFARLEVAATNLRDTLLTELGPGLGKSADGFAMALDILNMRLQQFEEQSEKDQAIQRIGLLGHVLTAGTIPINAFTKVLHSLDDGIASVNHTLDGMKDKTLFLRALSIAGNILSAGVVPANKLEAALINLDAAMDGLADTLDKTKASYGELENTMDNLTEKSFTFGSAMSGNVSRGLETVTGSLHDSNDASAVFYRHLLSTTEALPRGTHAWEVYAQSVRDTGTASEESAPSIREILNTLDSNIASPIGSFIDDLKFMMAGGAGIAGEYQSIVDALASGQISEEQATSMLENLYVVAQNISVEAGLATTYEAAKSVSEQLGIPMWEAYQTLKDIGAEWDAMSALDHTITMNIEADILKGQSEWDFLQKLVDDKYFSITLEADLFGGQGAGVPGSTGTHRPGTSDDPAVGPGPRPHGPHIGLADGGSFVVPPGYPSDSYVVGVTSGERVTVSPDGQAGGISLTIGDIIINGPGDPAAVRQAVVDGGNEVLGAARAKGLR